MAYNDITVTEEIGKLKSKGYVSLAGVFEKLWSSAIDDSDKEVYGNLYDVCMLSYHNGDAPYGPFFLPVGAKPHFSVSEKQYEVLSGVVEQISDCKLLARVADVLWLGSKQLGKADGFKYAKCAVEAFSKIPFDEATWISENVESDWARGLMLAKSLGRGLAAEYGRMQSSIRDVFIRACDTKNLANLFCWSIPQMLDNDQLCDVIPPKMIAERAEQLLAGTSQISDYTYDVYCDIARGWYSRAGCEEDAIRVLKKKVERSFRPILAEVSEPTPQWLKLQALCQRTIVNLQAIPHKNREGYEVEEKITFLKHIASLGGRLGLRHMHYMQSGPVDITAEVRNAESFIRGVRQEDVLMRFAIMFSMRETDAESLAYNDLNNSIIPHIMAKSVIKGGRVVAQAPSYSPCGADSDPKQVSESEKRVWVEKVQRASFLMQNAYHSCLRPAYEVMRSEHTFTFDEIVEFVHRSPLAPENHEKNIAEGLYLGYSGRFTAAAYILSPEIENIIREQLKFMGHDTTVIDNDSKLESEVGLSNLLEKYSDKLSQKFSSDFVFELRAIFCDHAGPNMRNEIAHGLKMDDTFNGVVDFYVWWFSVRLMCMRGCDSE